MSVSIPGRLSVHERSIPVSSGQLRQVVSGAIGRERVHFEAPSARRVPAEMDRFLDWLQGPGSGNAILDAGQAHLWFLTIHPYEDGNGRIARAISDAILTRASDQPGQRWYSVSAAISASKKDYYKALESQQRSDTNITPWQAYFIQTVSRAADMAHDTVAQVLRRSAWFAAAHRLVINDRQRSVARRMLEPDWEGQVSSSKYAGLARCSQDTATRDLKSLVALGLFEPGGKGGRSTSYAPVEHAPQARSQKPSTPQPASSAPSGNTMRGGSAISGDAPCCGQPPRASYSPRCRRRFMSGHAH